jgi:hypothetical protein
VRPEDRAALSQLALAVLHVLEGGHDEDRLLLQAVAQRAENGSCLGRVGRSGDERQGHEGEV